MLENKIHEGINALILAETGSGKTLSYVVPTLNKLFHTIESIKQQSESHSEQEPQSNKLSIKVHSSR